MPSITNDVARLVLSVDVEDWAQSTWDRSLEISLHSQRHTEHLLEILDTYGRTATMFVLGKFAERFPETIRRISEHGHEVASHGYGHWQLYSQTPEDFRQDVARSKRLLEDLTGQGVRGYRAPDFSVTRKTIWSLDVLAELGFQYDSSIFPIHSKRYGIHDWPVQPVIVQLPSGRSIVELPIATYGLLGRQWPVAGGGYHRLLPWPLIHQAISKTIGLGRPFVSYCHPYEFDSMEFDKLQFDIPIRTRVHQGLGRKRFHSKFIRMLKKFETSQALQIALGAEWPAYAI